MGADQPTRDLRPGLQEVQGEGWEGKMIFFFYAGERRIGSEMDQRCLWDGQHDLFLKTTSQRYHIS